RCGPHEWQLRADNPAPRTVAHPCMKGPGVLAAGRRSRPWDGRQRLEANPSRTRAARPDECLPGRRARPLARPIRERLLRRQTWERSKPRANSQAAAANVSASGGSENAWPRPADEELCLRLGEGSAGVWSRAGPALYALDAFAARSALRELLVSRMSSGFNHDARHDPQVTDGQGFPKRL